MSYLRPTKLAKAMARQEMCERAEDLIATGHSQAEIAIQLGISTGQLSKLLKVWRESGAERWLHGPKRGRKPCARLTEAEVVVVKGRVMKGMSQVMALRTCAMEGLLGDAVADAILHPRGSKHEIPPYLRDQVRVPQAVKDYARSARRYQLNQVITPRGNTQCIDGVTTELLPGDWYCWDDMTLNFAWWYDTPDGPKCTRGQLLACLDIASLCFLGFEIVGRKNESYRAADVWAAMGKVVRDVGKPRHGMQLEGNIWQGNHIKGSILGGEQEAGSEEDEVLPAKTRVGGMAYLGIRMARSYMPKTKAIEARFNFLQNLMSHLPGNLGRSHISDKFTRAWATFERCRRGAEDPRDHLPHITEMADAVQAAMDACNREPVETDAGDWIPAHRFEASVTAKPLEKISDDFGWIFAREKKVVTLRGRKQSMALSIGGTAGDAKRWFGHASLQLVTPDNAKVMVLYDPLQTAGKAVILSADSRVLRVGEREISLGDTICVAEQLAEAPKIKNGPGGEFVNREIRKECADLVRTEYRSLAGPKASRRKIGEAYHGNGNAAQVASIGDTTVRLPDPLPRDEPAPVSRGGRGMGAADREPAPCARGRLCDAERAELERLAYGLPEERAAEEEIIF